MSGRHGSVRVVFPGDGKIKGLLTLQIGGDSPVQEAPCQGDPKCSRSTCSSFGNGDWSMNITPLNRTDAMFRLFALKKGSWLSIKGSQLSLLEILVVPDHGAHA